MPTVKKRLKLGTLLFKKIKTKQKTKHPKI